MSLLSALRRNPSDQLLLDFYERIYRPARHPGDANSGTAKEYRSSIRALSRPKQFAKWLANQPASDATPQQLYRKFKACSQMHLIPEGQLRISDLTDDLVVEAMNFLITHGVSRTTANKVRRTIHAVWTMAYYRKLIDRMPRVEKFREEKHEPIAWTQENLIEIVKAAEQEPGQVGVIPAAVWWPAAILFLYSLGIRLGAALQVRSCDVDFERGLVRIAANTQKQKAEQVLDLLPSAVDRLRRLYLVEREVPTVLGDFAGHPNTLRRIYKGILVRAGLFESIDAVDPKMLFHGLRKTLASHLHRAGGLEAVRARLGHSSLNVTRAYLDPRFRPETGIRGILDDVFPRSSPPGWE